MNISTGATEMEPIFTIPPYVINQESDVLPLSGETNWGIATFGVERLRERTDGRGVIVGVVDTGVYAEHPLLAPNVLGAKSFVAGESANDGNGHGTHCSGTILATDPRIGMAPGAKLYHAKGLSNGGSGGGQGIAAGIDWLVSQGCEIISMSLGSPSQDTYITDAMKRAADAGVWVVCAAGNSGPNTPDVDWPGRSPHCISVAALASDLSPASFSSAGAKIDTAFAGVNIWSTRSGGGFVQMSGTSMATPGIAGVLALYRSALKLQSAGAVLPNIAQLRKLLADGATDVYTAGRDRRTGPGAITPLLMSIGIEPDPLPIQS